MESKKEASKVDASKPGNEKKEEVLLEEDDEFLEFEKEGWTKAEVDLKDVEQWQDDWDDDNIDDTFCKQLRAQLKETESK